MKLLLELLNLILLFNLYIFLLILLSLFFFFILLYFILLLLIVIIRFEVLNVIKILILVVFLCLDELERDFCMSLYKVID